MTEGVEEETKKERKRREKRKKETEKEAKRQQSQRTDTAPTNIQWPKMEERESEYVCRHYGKTRYGLFFGSMKKKSAQTISRLELKRERERRGRPRENRESELRADVHFIIYQVHPWFFTQTRTQICLFILVACSPKGRVNIHLLASTTKRRVRVSGDIKNHENFLCQSYRPMDQLVCSMPTYHAHIPRLEHPVCFHGHKGYGRPTHHTHKKRKCHAISLLSIAQQR